MLDLLERLRKAEETRTGWARVDWTDTDMSMGVRCLCGVQEVARGKGGHYVKCEACGRLYAVGPHVRLYEVEESPTESTLTIARSKRYR